MGVDGDGRGLSLQCVLPGLPPRLAANMLHLGLGWGSSPGDQEPSRASICSLSPAERAHTSQACGPELVSLLHRASVSPLPRGGEVWGSNLLLSAGRCRRGLGQSLTSGSELTQARGAGTPSQVPSICPPR